MATNDAEHIHVAASSVKIEATTNSGISQVEPYVLATVVIPKPKLIYNDTKDYAEFDKEFSPRILRDNQKDFFTVAYKTLKGESKTFHFDLLPAIENRGGGALRAGDVPEAKPGILRMLETRHKNIVIPGATPVVQSIGIRSALVNLVGTFTGADGLAAEAKIKDDVLMGKFGDKSDPMNDSYATATNFHNEVVLPMTQVTVVVSASLGSRGATVMKYDGVIIKFKDYAVRSNRTYYTIDLLVTSYKAHQVTEIKPLTAVQSAAEGASKENTKAIEDAVNAVKKAEADLKAKREAYLKAESGEAETANVALREAEKTLEEAQKALDKELIRVNTEKKEGTNVG